MDAGVAGDLAVYLSDDRDRPAALYVAHPDIDGLGLSYVCSEEDEVLGWQRAREDENSISVGRGHQAKDDVSPSDVGGPRVGTLNGSGVRHRLSPPSPEWLLRKHISIPSDWQYEFLTHLLPD